MSNKNPSHDLENDELKENDSLDMSETIEEILQDEAEDYAREYDKQNNHIKTEIIQGIFGKNKNTFKMLKDIEEININNNINWINIVGVNKSEEILDLQEKFDLYPLILKDIFSDKNRVKIEKYENDNYILVDYIKFNQETLEFEFDKVSIILRGNMIISILNDDDDIFGLLRRKINNMKDFYLSNPNTLVFMLIDELVNSYFEVLDDVGEVLDDIEDELVEDINKKSLHKIYLMKKNMLYVKKSIQPIHSIINKIYIDSNKKIDSSTEYFFRDVYNHVIQLADLIEVYRETIIGLIDTYTTIIGNKTNDVMMILTVWSTIFLPLSFLTGVFGMNFKYMPELDNPMAYPLFWIIVLFIILAMIVYFKKKDWI